MHSLAAVELCSCSREVQGGASIDDVGAKIWLEAGSPRSQLESR